MSPYSNYNRSKNTQEIYTYKGQQVVIITVFKTGVNALAIVEDICTGEQFEVFRNELHKVQDISA